MPATSNSAFSIHETHGVLRRPEFDILQSSDGLGWRTLYASWQREQPYRSRCSPTRDPLVVIGMGPAGLVRVKRRLNGAESISTAARRGIFVLPAGDEYDLELFNPLETLHMYVRQSVIAEAVAELAFDDPAHVELRPTMGEGDAGIASIGTLCREMMCERQPDYFADAIGRTLAARLVQHHSTVARFAPDQKRGLSLPKLDRVVELIDASLEEGLSLAEMAAAVHLSPIHFARMFRRSTGVSPHQYLINRRVLRAKDGLLPRNTRRPAAPGIRHPSVERRPRLAHALRLVAARAALPQPLQSNPRSASRHRHGPGRSRSCEAALERSRIDQHRGAARHLRASRR